MAITVGERKLVDCTNGKPTAELERRPASYEIASQAISSSEPSPPMMTWATTLKDAQKSVGAGLSEVSMKIAERPKVAVRLNAP